MQMSLFDLSPEPQIPLLPEIVIDPHSYDHVIVAFSGGKDSLACLLYLLSLGVSRSVIELWHHDIDGRENGSKLMDWPITRDYCRAIADALQIPIYYSWKVGGMEGEMLRENSLTAPTLYETPDGIKQSGGIRGALTTRRLYPQQSADLSVRWCSSYLKIDVCSKSMVQSRFDGKRVLLVTGERAEESTSRACYHQAEKHRTSAKKRHVDHWRPVHQWEESQVWEIIERYSIAPHPCYKLGWGRCSCSACIFGSKDQWASLSLINPEQVDQICQYEKEFGKTINRKLSVPQMIAQGKPYPNMHPDDIKAALSDTFEGPVILPEGTWKLPAGAYGENAGPT
jgi:3'-phosphoadenosine 5'-phosphosulfate sulfotransferase (PAPS reductase)/FAD synthetase